MQPPRPRVRFTSEVTRRLREETANQRTRLVQALTALHADLPREAGGLLDAVSPPGYPDCFPWSRVFLDGGTWWRLDCVVSKAGRPDVLWVVELFATEM